MPKLKYFKPEEFEKCVPWCEITDMDADFLLALDQLRENCGFPLKLNCAFRSRSFDMSKGRSGHSMHCSGRAVDISCTDALQRAKIIEEAFKLGLRVGVACNFVHVDDKNRNVDNLLDRLHNVLWVY